MHQIVYDSIEVEAGANMKGRRLFRMLHICGVCENRGSPRRRGADIRIKQPGQVWLAEHSWERLRAQAFVARKQGAVVVLEAWTSGAFWYILRETKHLF